MKQITSVNNEYIKSLAKLNEKKYRDEFQMYLIEGEHLIKEASQYLETVLIINEAMQVAGVQNILVTEEIIKKISKTKTPQNMIGVCRIHNKNLKYDGKKYLLLDNIQDPGNLGTLVRSALAFNVDYVVVEKSVDIYNDKFIRSTQGAFYHTNVVKGELKEVISNLKHKNIPVFGTRVDNGKPLNEIKPQEQYGLILGNEGNGVRKELLDLVDNNIYIPMNEKLESLNVAAAGAIIMYSFR